MLIRRWRDILSGANTDAARQLFHGAFTHNATQLVATTTGHCHLHQSGDHFASLRPKLASSFHRFLVSVHFQSLRYFSYCHLVVEPAWSNAPVQSLFKHTVSRSIHTMEISVFSRYSSSFSQHHDKRRGDDTLAPLKCVDS